MSLYTFPPEQQTPLFAHRRETASDCRLNRAQVLDALGHCARERGSGGALVCGGLCVSGIIREEKEEEDDEFETREMRGRVFQLFG